VHIEIEPRVDPQRSKRRRQEVSRSRRDARQRVAMAPVVAGREADDGGRWAVRRIMAMRRHDGRRGRPLDVLVEWEGEDSDGDMWEESWVSVSYLSADLRADARRLEAELFGPRAAQAGPASRRDTLVAWRRGSDKSAKETYSLGAKLYRSLYILFAAIYKYLLTYMCSRSSRWLPGP